jgi:hypothetical protein
MTTNHLWKELHINLHIFSNFKILNELKPITNIPLGALVSRLNYLKHLQLEQTTSYPLWDIILIISRTFVFDIAILLGIYFFFRKRILKHKQLPKICHSSSSQLNMKGETSS